MIKSQVRPDTAPPAAASKTDPPFLRDVLAGLASSPKTLPCKYFYDDRGSKLFERICETPEYYITRTEIAMLREIGPDIAAYLGPGSEIVELGAGAGIKVQLLIDALVAAGEPPLSFTMVDICEETLARAARTLQQRYPGLEIVPSVGDYATAFALPARTRQREEEKRLLFFPGSSIGNFAPADAGQFLSRIHTALEPGDALLIGVDLIKADAILNAAYNDAAGVTAAFNLNLLWRIRDNLDTDLDPDAFQHRAFFNRDQSRIEMHLVSRNAQTVTIQGKHFHFAEGETVHTENSYKYSVEGFQQLAGASGFRLQQTWTDPLAYFSLHCFEV